MTPITIPISVDLLAWLSSAMSAELAEHRATRDRLLVSNAALIDRARAAELLAKRERDLRYAERASFCAARDGCGVDSALRDEADACHRLRAAGGVP